ncbi:MAG: alginate export family protein [Pirellulaceae bacterium]
MLTRESIPKLRKLAAACVPALASVLGLGQFAWADEPTSVIERVAVSQALAADEIAATQLNASQPTVTLAAAHEGVSVARPTCVNKEKQEAATKAMKSAYAGVFYANNFGYLTDPYYNGPAFLGESFKNMQSPLGTVSLGGETRSRYHNEDNHRGLGITGRDDQFWLFRQRLYADWRVNNLIRVYGETLYADSGGETFAPRPIEENNFDMLNLFVDVNLLSGNSGNLTLRGGRQELLFGAQRTISPLDWANTRRTFEGLRGLYQNGDTSIDAFWTAFVPVRPNDFDQADYDQQFYGVYLTQKNTLVGTLEGYYLGYDQTDPATPDFSYHTLGSRASGTTAGGWLYDLEGAVQFGDNFTADDHSAMFTTLGLGRALKSNLLSPTVWFYYDYASGEEDFVDVSRGDGGYDHLFPLAHKYNGFMDLFGRRNLHDINVFSSTPLGKNVSMVLWYHYFLLAEATTPYSVVMTPYNTTTAAGDRELGHEIDLLFDVTLNARSNILLGYSHFAAGDYYSTTAGLPPGVAADADANFFYAQFQTRY